MRRTSNFGGKSVAAWKDQATSRTRLARTYEKILKLWRTPQFWTPFGALMWE